MPLHVSARLQSNAPGIVHYLNKPGFVCSGTTLHHAGDTYFRTQSLRLNLENVFIMPFSLYYTTFVFTIAYWKLASLFLTNFFSNQVFFWQSNLVIEF